MLLQFFSERQKWRLVHDPKFEAGRKVHKRILEQKIREMKANEVAFISTLKKLANKFNWPWDAEEPPARYDPYT